MLLLTKMLRKIGLPSIAISSRVRWKRSVAKLSGQLRGRRKLLRKKTTGKKAKQMMIKGGLGTAKASAGGVAAFAFAWEVGSVAHALSAEKSVGGRCL